MLVYKKLIVDKSLPKTFRYIVSGSTGAVVNIGTLFVLKHFFDVWYLLASIIAFIASFLVSFYLQRTWTFQKRASHSVVRHMSLYFVTALFNLALNTGIVYVLVEYVGLWYILAQLFGGGVVALFSYFIYQYVIFVDTPEKIL